MKKMSVSQKHKLYHICVVWVWVAYTSCPIASKAYKGNPLQGSKAPLPGDAQWLANTTWLLGGGGKFVYYGDDSLTRLLDVGACLSGDSSDDTISYVPPLDGTGPTDLDVLCQDQYAMKFVLFDLQLVDLKAVDPIGGSFQAEFQMVLHWIDTVISGSNGTKFTDDCSFPCHTGWPRPLCCDSVWVPPLHLPTCDIHTVHSSTPRPYFVEDSTAAENLTYDDCFKPENAGKCFSRRLWYLNIDVTCDSQMDFHNFPFDVQKLTIDIFNPYASRTWFQLTKGFFQQNIDEDINTEKLSPDAKIPGWTVKEVSISSSCATAENWKQTFLTQNSILRAINETYEAQRMYESQYEEIMSTLNPEALNCPNIEDLNNINGYDNSSSFFDFEPYKKTKAKYKERVYSTLKELKQCMKEKGSHLPWNMSMPQNRTINLNNFSTFDNSIANQNRSFNILDVEGGPNETKVSSRCAILAVANLTTLGIKITILVQRYGMFYVIKLILPTVACVLFSLAAFGLQPQDLVGRLTVVVPAAISLTALQSLVVSTDIPPVAYVAPTTYIFLLSYAVQLIVSFESIVVSWMDSRAARGATSPGRVKKDGESQKTESDCETYEKETRRGRGLSDQGSASHSQDAGIQTQEKEKTESDRKINATRKFDICFGVGLSVIYGLSILLFQLKINSRSASDKVKNSVRIWPAT